MAKTLEFPVLLRLIDERSAAFRAAVASAPGLDAQVPSCPDWTLLDLVRHLGGVHRFWATVVAAGPADAPPAERSAQLSSTAPQEREALLAWAAESTELLLGALREAGPDRGCWTWWAGSQSPQTSGAVARHQAQEAMVHTYDAQITADAPQPLPAEAALDGVDEFLSTCCAGPYTWPYEPAVVDYHATEGRSWRLSLSADGVQATHFPESGTEPATAAAASARGTAGELVLALYSRIPVDSLKVDGDARIFDQLLAWDPDDA
ncbi:maleylpyruvate isomerase N-terminal domain-containing protein [Streptomyces sp. NPDC102437]|uniref:maleylpyruvate isomerase N-terminal domain-containing protein n=1 Tax=Streptomyces sp. NPDC102437 TaxID=3366175 RepID=UPI0038199BB4